MILNRIVEIILLTMALSGIMCVMLATIYDLEAAASWKHLELTARRVLHRRKPTITVLLYHCLSASQVLGATKGIRRNSYRAIDYVAVIDTDVPFYEKRALYETMKDIGCKAYKPRKTYNPEGLLRNAYQRSKKGDFVLIVSANEQVDDLMIGHAVAHLETNRILDGVQFAQRTLDVSSLLELARTFLILSRQMITKALDVVRIRNKRLDSSGLYRRSVLLSKGFTGVKYSVGYNAKATVAHALIIKPRWRLWKTVLQVAFLALFGYSAVVAATLQSATPLVLSWLIVGLWLVAAVWSDETNRLTNKIALSLCVPVGYFVVVGALAVNGAASIVRRPSEKSFYIL